MTLDGVKPLTVTLPHPILPCSPKIVFHQDHGVVEIVATKDFPHGLSSSDDVRPVDPRWDSEALETWDDEETLAARLDSLVLLDDHKTSETPIISEAQQVSQQVRYVIRDLFVAATQQSDQPLFQVRVKGSTKDTAWFIRAHPPVRTSPDGDPILLLSVMDHHLAEGMEDGDEQLDTSRATEDFLAAFDSLNTTTKVDPVVISLDAVEGGQFLRYILRRNAAKIQPTPWQVDNLPSIGKPECPWLLASFVQPFWDDDLDDDNEPESSTPLPAPPSRRCWNCSKSSDDKQLKRCGRCKSVSYCSVECQRADWPGHKSSCSAA